MDDVLQNFLTAARAAGVRISTAEGIDAVTAVRHVGYGDRELLRSALAATLAKSIPEKRIFEDCFERFFTFAPFGQCAEADSHIVLNALETTGAPISPLTLMLLEGDQTGLAAALAAAARQENLSAIRYSIQRNRYAWQILARMGIAGLDAQVRALRDHPLPEVREAAPLLADMRERLVDSVREYVRRQAEIFADAQSREQEETRLRHANLSGLEMRDYEKMHLMVQKIVKRLNDLSSRRRKAARRGQLDFKRTLRRNVTYQGLIFDPSWRRQRRDRPEVVAICDVSRSVIRVVRFLLLFLHSLNKDIVGIRSFVFCTNMVEITDILEKYPVAEALARIQGAVDLPLIMGRTDYERALGEFCETYLSAVGHKTTVLILGDARNNYNDPCPGNLKKIAERARRLIWLNPEIPPAWGAGDSEIHRFAPYCTRILECNTVSHLERLVATLLRK
ncbi:MAG: VWA domain-containing protein [Syntrophales bacterium]|nr:VWA domain-containing protein [Syntrophales bacterium]